MAAQDSLAGGRINLRCRLTMLNHKALSSIERNGARVSQALLQHHVLKVAVLCAIPIFTLQKATAAVDSLLAIDADDSRA